MTLKRILLSLSLLIVFSFAIHGVFQNNIETLGDNISTEFEESGANTWTSLENEVEFLNKINSMSNRVNVSIMGNSEGGHPIHLVSVSNPSILANLNNKRTILIMGSVHGDEPAGREMTFQMIKKLAFTNEMDSLDLLKKVTVLFMPTPNPDGRLRNTRGNFYNVNNNRDHLNLISEENKVIAKVLNEYKPDIIIDAHERPKSKKTDIQLLWPRNLNVEKDLYEINRRMVEDVVWQDLEEKGYSVDQYGSPGGLGGESERILRNLGSLRYSLTILIESAGKHDPLKRVDAHINTVNSVIGFYIKNFDEITSIVDNAPNNKQAEYNDAKGTFYFKGADNYKSESQKMDEHICGYLLSPAQLKEIKDHIELFSIEFEEMNEKRIFIPMDQPMLTVIPFLVDERAEFNEVKGVPLTDCKNFTSESVK